MRRRFLALALAGLLLPLAVLAGPPSPGLPASPSGTVVVELLNFHCPRCRVVNDYYDALRQAAEAQGLALRIAPAAWEGQSIWPDKVYYAARDLFPAAEGLVRDALFDGIQREGLLFEELPQVIAYLERRQLPSRAKALDPAFNLLAIADRASTDIPLFSEMKAGRLLDLSGATEVPVFVWVRDGNVVDTLSPTDASEPAALVQRVIRKMGETFKKDPQ